jgi:hypothetical protein
MVLQRKHPCFLILLLQLNYICSSALRNLKRRLKRERGRSKGGGERERERERERKSVSYYSQMASLTSMSKNKCYFDVIVIKMCLQ